MEKHVQGGPKARFVGDSGTFELGFYPGAPEGRLLLNWSDKPTESLKAKPAP